MRDVILGKAKMARPRLSDGERAAREATRQRDMALKAAIGGEVVCWLRGGRPAELERFGVAVEDVRYCEHWAKLLEKGCRQKVEEALSRVVKKGAKDRHVAVVLGGEVLRAIREGRACLASGSEVGLTDETRQRVAAASAMVSMCRLALGERGALVDGLDELVEVCERLATRVGHVSRLGDM